MQKLSQPQRIAVITLGVIIVIFLGALILTRSQTDKSEQTIQAPSITPLPSSNVVDPVDESTTTVSPDEQANIDRWITENDLNEYGDPNDTVYAGGTPLFNEMTGEYTDRYEYIVQNHPDKPWNN